LWSLEAKDLSEAIRNYVLAAGVLGAVFGLWLAYRRTEAQENTNRIAEHNAREDSVRTERARRDARFAQAVELLGHDSPEVRLGAIYALEPLAQEIIGEEEVPPYHWRVLETLSAYLRHRRNKHNPLTSEEGEILDWPLSVDEQAALTAVGRRNTAFDQNADQTKKRKIDLSNCNLVRAVMMDLNFQGVQFFGSILYEIQGARAKFTLADLRGADLTFSKLFASDFQTANLKDARMGFVVLDRANLSGAYLAGVQLSEINQDKTIPMRADLTKCTIEYDSWMYAKSRGAAVDESPIEPPRNDIFDRY